MILYAVIFVMVIICFFGVLLGADFTGIIVEPNITGSETSELIKAVLTEMGYDTTPTTIFTVGEIDGFLAILTVIIVIAGIVGLQILGSGLSEEGHKIIMACIIYGGLWSLLSIIAMPLILSIVEYGYLIYLGLTCAYVIGVIKKLTED